MEYDASTFATTVLSTLAEGAGGEVGSFLGGLLLNAILQSNGFSTESSELSEIISLETEIQNELNQLAGEISLSTINIETFQSVTGINTDFGLLQSYTASTSATEINQFIQDVMEPTTGMNLLLNSYQTAVMQNNSISVGPGQSVFAAVTGIILDQYWGKVPLADMLAVWQNVFNKIVAQQVKGLSVYYNAAYAQAVMQGATPLSAATTASSTIQPFISGGSTTTADLQHQMSAFLASVPDWLLNQQQGTSTSMSTALKNKFYGTFLVVTQGDRDGYALPGTSATIIPAARMNMTSQAVDSTDFTVGAGNAIAYLYYTDKIGFVAFAFGSTSLVWRLMPFIDDNGIVATRLATTDYYDNNAWRYLCIDHGSLNVDVTTDTESDDSLWFFQAMS